MALMSSLRSVIFVPRNDDFEKKANHPTIALVCDECLKWVCDCIASALKYFVFSVKNLSVLSG